MIQSKQELRDYLEADAQQFRGKKPGFKAWLMGNEVWYIHRLKTELRFVEYNLNMMRRNRLYVLPYLFHLIRYKRLCGKTHIMIHPNTVGPGLRIYHIGAFTYVKKNAQIGKNCTILQGVVFGDKSGVEEHVVVGDNCSFGLDAKILGSLTIGDNVKVGANAVVTKDIPSYAIVGGVPGKIIKYLR